MARYFFDIYDDGGVALDEEGVELAGLEEMRRAALEALPDLVRGERPRSDRRILTIKVRDSGGDGCCTPA